MAALPRIFHKIFAGNLVSGKLVQFGSTVTGTPNPTPDPAAIAALTAWGNGWQDSVIGANRAPSMQEMNALEFYHSRQIGYLFQSGIPEYDASTTYFTGSVVRVGAYWYQALQDNFSAQTPPAAASNAYWNWVNQPGTATGVIADGGGYTAPAGWGFCDGLTDTRAGQAALFNYLTASRGITTVSGSANITVTGTLPSGLAVGHFVEGPGIPDGSTVHALPGGLVVTLDHNCGASASVTALFSPWGFGLQSGDGYTTFNRPTILRAVSYAAGSGMVIGMTGGAETVTLTDAQCAVRDHGHSAKQTTNANDGGTGSGSNDYYRNMPFTGDTLGVTNLVAINAATTPHNNMMPYVVLPKIIKY